MIPHSYLSPHSCKDSDMSPWRMYVCVYKCIIMNNTPVIDFIQVLVYWYIPGIGKLTPPAILMIWQTKGSPLTNSVSENRKEPENKGDLVCTKNYHHLTVYRISDVLRRQQYNFNILEIIIIFLLRVYGLDLKILSIWKILK